MNIASWLDAALETDAEFARRIGISRQSLHRYKAGHRVPRKEILLRISRATGGAVTAADFYQAESYAPANDTAPAPSEEVA